MLQIVVIIKIIPHWWGTEQNIFFSSKAQKQNSFNVSSELGKILAKQILLYDVIYKITLFCRHSI